jgi:hypothetical protein
MQPAAWPRGLGPGQCGPRLMRVSMRLANCWNTPAGNFASLSGIAYNNFYILRRGLACATLYCTISYTSFSTKRPTLKPASTARTSFEIICPNADLTGLSTGAFHLIRHEALQRSREYIEHNATQNEQYCAVYIFMMERPI